MTTVAHPEKRFAASLNKFLKKFDYAEQENLTRCFTSQEDCTKFAAALGEKDLAPFQSSNLAVSRRHVYSLLSKVAGNECPLWKGIYAFVKAGIAERFLTNCCKNPDLLEYFDIDNFVSLIKKFVDLCTFITNHPFIATEKNRKSILQRTPIASYIFSSTVMTADFLNLLMSNKVLSPILIMPDVWISCPEIHAAVVEFANQNFGSSLAVPIEPSPPQAPCPPSIKCWRTNTSNALMQKSLEEFFEGESIQRITSSFNSEEECERVAEQLGEKDTSIFCSRDLVLCRMHLAKFIESNAKVLKVWNLLLALTIAEKKSIVSDLIHESKGIQSMLDDFFTLTKMILNLREFDQKTREKVLQDCFVDDAAISASEFREQTLKELGKLGSFCPSQIRIDIWTGAAREHVTRYCEIHNLVEQKN